MRTKILYGIVILLAVIVVSGLSVPREVSAQNAGGIVPSTAQIFEHGWMMWRSDTGSIYVFLDYGLFYHFRSDEYGGLLFNTRADNGYIMPIMGFGQVWGNMEWLRNQLGNAVGSEFSFNPLVVDQSHGLVMVEDWNGRQIQTLRVIWVLLPRVSGGAPSYTPTPIVGFPMTTPTPPVPTYTYFTDAAFQLYERGFMVWRADTGDILVFFGDFLNGSGGTMLLIPLWWYQEFPENSQPRVPEPYVDPINGFGRVWGTLSDVRERLGYAVTSETAYQMTLELENGAYGKGWLSLPDGTQLYILTGRWSF